VTEARPPRSARPATIALWGGFVAVLALKLLFVSDRGTGDMDTALGWGHTLLHVGLVRGYTGSNFPIAFQLYEGLVTLADHLGVNEYLAMKSFDLACDVGTFFLLRVLLRRWDVNPAWAFAYWLSPYFLVMTWLGYDHFQMGLLVVGLLLAIDRAWRRQTVGTWALAAFVMGIGFLQRPQFQALVAALALYGGFVAIDHLRRRAPLRAALVNRETAPVLWLLGGAAVFFAGYSIWFWVGGKYATFLVHSYATVSAFSPALSANMLNVWAMVAEAYRHGPEQLTMVTGPHYWHLVAGLLGIVVLLGGTWLIARRHAQRPFPLTALYLFAFASLALPNVYTRAHENHFFLAALLLVPVMAIAQRRVGVFVALAATSALQAFNMFSIYGFGSVSQTYDSTTLDVRSVWTWGVRFAAAAVCTAIFVALLVMLRELTGPRGDAPTAPSADG
jgi:hypothetical protein